LPKREHFSSFEKAEVFQEKQLKMEHPILLIIPESLLLMVRKNLNWRVLVT